MRAFRHCAVVVVAALAAACGGSSPPAAPLVAEATTTTSSTAPIAQTTSSTLAPTTTATTFTARSTSTTSARSATVATTRRPTADPRLDQVGAAGQAIVVTAAAGASTATLTAYERTSDGWRTVFGPWTARVGSRGIAAPGEKREGDGRTPSGVYGFDFMFGVAADPGVSFPYRRVTSRSIVWDDDSASPLYNTWVDLDRQAAGTEPEPMYARPAYDHGAVIAYNAARTPGLGSAIFLHVSTGAATAGCVSLPAAQLVEILRWLDPAHSPRIVLGTGA